MNKHYLFIALRICIVIAGTIAGIFAIYFVGKLVIPFIIGFLIALFLNPLVEFLQKHTKMHRSFAVIVSILIVTGIISAIITLLVNEMVQGFAYLSIVVPEHYHDFMEFIKHFYTTKALPFYSNLLDLFQDLDESQKSAILDSIQFVGQRVTDTLSDLVQSFGNLVITIIKSLPTIVTVLIISMLAAFFISKDWYRIVKGLREKTPDKVVDRINSIYEGLYRALFGYLKAEFKITFISAVIVFIGLLIMRVEHALSIALIIWFIDFLPYIGAIIIFCHGRFMLFQLGISLSGLDLPSFTDL